MKEVFSLKESLPYCTKFPFETRNIRTVTYGKNILSFLGPKIWAIVPTAIKKSKSLTEFKNEISKWNPEHCPCRLCDTYITDLGFINTAV